MAAGELALDLEAHSLRIAGAEPLRLTKLETRLLQILIANAGHVVGTERLLTHVWGHRGSGDRQLLKQLVRRLRQKIEADPAEPRYLQTEPGAGYRLVGLMRTIVIVGGGFCGTVLATMLLRRPPATPTRLVLIERGRACRSRGRLCGARLSVPAQCPRRPHVRQPGGSARVPAFHAATRARTPMPRASCRAPGTATTSRSRSRQRRSRRPGTSGST